MYYHHQTQQQQVYRHGSSSSHVDPVAMRQKEEQRRKQQAYAQALAQQVQQREIQKQREREVERQGTSHGRPGQGQMPVSGGSNGFQQQHQQHHEATKGFWDGFGERANANRTNFARGQRQPMPSTPPQTHHMSPSRHNQAPSGYPAEVHEPIGLQQHPSGLMPGGFAGADLPGHGAPHTFAQPQPLLAALPPPPFGMDAAGHLHDWGAPLQALPFGQHYEQQQQDAEHYGDGRARLPHEPHLPLHSDQQHHQDHLSDPRSGPRPDGAPNAPAVGNAGFGSLGAGIGDHDDTKARRKLQQQQEMQLALQRQVEEKAQQKREAKRRQDEEDRREAERFEAEQQRLKQADEQAKALKRRKEEEELARAQQAAAALVDHKRAQHRHHHQQQQQSYKEHSQQSPVRTQHEQPQSPPQRRAPATHTMDPFANSRAHLFQDPPVASHDRSTSGTEPHRQLAPPHAAGHYAEHMRSTDGQSRPAHSFEHHEQQHGQVDRGWRIQPPSSAPTAIDSTVLLRQYDEMKDELMRQRQVVDQLRQAHAQLQMQSQSLASASSPTLSDLEQLRSELRAELERREQLHRQELEKFRLQHEQLQLVRTRSDLRVSVSRSARREPQQETPIKELASSTPVRRANNRASVSEERELGSTSSHAVLRRDSSKAKASLVPLASLQCDSKLVYFDGRVQQEQPSTAVAAEERRASPRSRRHVQRQESVTRIPELALPRDATLNARSAEAPRSDVEAQRRQASSQALGIDGAAVHRSNSDRKQQQRHRLPEAAAPETESESEGDNDDDEFFVQDLRCSVSKQDEGATSAQPHRSRLASPSDRGASRRYASWTDASDDPTAHSDLSASCDATSGLAQPTKWRLLLDDGKDDSEDEDGGVDMASASLTGDELDAIFQRNVRRHEILSGFQRHASRSTDEAQSNQHDATVTTKFHRGTARRTTAWAELHEQLEANVQNKQRSHESTQRGRTYHTTAVATIEDSLVASSRWMHTAT